MQERKSSNIMYHYRLEFMIQKKNTPELYLSQEAYLKMTLIPYGNPCLLVSSCTELILCTITVKFLTIIHRRDDTACFQSKPSPEFRSLLIR